MGFHRSLTLSSGFAVTVSILITILHPKTDLLCDAFSLQRPGSTWNGNNAKTWMSQLSSTEDDTENPEVPPPGHSIRSDNSGPNGSPVHTLTIHLGANDSNPHQPLVFETGKIGRQASGSITLSRGDTILYSTACRDKEPRPSISFLPLSVEYQERFSSVGNTKGGFIKRDGRPAEHEILTCRLIDRPLRPLIAEGWRHETQLLSWVLGYDGLRDCTALAISSAAAALWISDVPLRKAVAAAHVGYIDGTGFVLNPTLKQMKRSRLDMTMAGTKDAVLMIEGAADFLSENQMVQAVAFGHEAIKTITAGLEELGSMMGKEKKLDTIEPPIEGLDEAVNSLMSAQMEAAFGTSDKSELSSLMSSMTNKVIETLGQDEKYAPDGNTNAIKESFKKMQSRIMYQHAKNTGERIDGRALNEVRKIDINARMLPTVHGSALFTRGETQTLATATLGDAGMKQRIDKLDGTIEKNFYLQYTFPPSCVGETGRVGMPGRREIGHGNLAERAIVPALPSISEFPYSVRLESLITESNGSSSMASVCGGCVALLDAGVPLKTSVAGIAMGMLLDDNQGSVEDEDAIIVSDILGTEDALGTMDFKVAGDREGITTFQLDIKCEGLSLKTMERALLQAKEGRLHILNEMDKCLSEPQELPSTVPKILSFDIAQDLIGRVIGPGGKQVRAVIEDFGLVNMNLSDDGNVQITGYDQDKVDEAKEFVMNLIADAGGGGRGPRPTYQGKEQPEIGKTYRGKIKNVHPFGVFVEILPGAEDGSYPGLEGLCHISELNTKRVSNCEDFVKSLGTDEIDVKLIGEKSNGKMSLSRKATLINN